jgi:16S rRNA (cytosine967-C5)-methyltransferase
MNPSASGPRLAAAQALMQVLDHGQSLDAVLDQLVSALENSRDRSLARRLCHGVLRDWPALNRILDQLLKKPPARRERVVFFVLAVGLSELRDGREPDHAVVHSAVEAVRSGSLHRLASLTNAVLRNFLRQRERLEQGLDDDPVCRWGYPRWLIERVQADWPQDWSRILQAGNQPPPLWLRVNRRHWSREQACRALQEAGHEVMVPDGLTDALALGQRAAVSRLPGFAEGGLSVQDGAAQLSVEYLDLADGQRVLDACAAPGGKSAHMLERAAVDLTAIDIDSQRLARVAENLDRLQLKARLMAADAASPADWWDGQPFDRILIDAPCSATGVIRRHPDIRWLRKADDIDTLATVQSSLLDALWPLLAADGILVYATCSVISAENHQQVRSFMERHEHLDIIEHEQLPGQAMSPGRQILPGEMDLDGFYHCAVRRLPA